MINTLIFDLDNTLIEWKDEYIFGLKNALNKLNIKYSDSKIKQIDEALTDYENHNILCDKQKFLSTN